MKKSYYYIGLLVALWQLSAIGLTEEEQQKLKEQYCFKTFELPLMQKRSELENTPFFRQQKRSRLTEEIKQLEQQSEENGC